MKKHFKIHKVESEILNHLLSGTVLLMCGCSSILSAYFKVGTESLRLTMLAIMLVGVALRIGFSVLKRKNIIEVEDMDPEEEIRFYYAQGVMLNQSELIFALALLASLAASFIKSNELGIEIKFVEGLAFLMGVVDINKGIVLSNEMSSEDYYE